MWGGARRLNGNVGALVCYALPLTLLVVNVFGLLVATHLNGGSLDRKVAEAIRTEVPEGSLVLVTGQTLGARGGHIATYFYRLRFHSVSFDVLMRGEDKWKGRLAEVINLTTSAHLPVVVLSDLLGEPSPSGIGLSPSEFPRPTVDETREAITNLVVEQRRMRVGSFQFVVMRAP